jgi:hypothetical protein
MQKRTLASLYALIFGGVLVVAGIIGFFMRPSSRATRPSATPCSASST